MVVDVVNEIFLTFLWSPEIDYIVGKNPLLASILTQITLLHTCNPVSL
jgi:predicted metal-dependent HD superfamily phosphohydrolase